MGTELKVLSNALDIIYDAPPPRRSPRWRPTGLECSMYSGHITAEQMEQQRSPQAGHLRHCLYGNCYALVRGYRACPFHVDAENAAWVAAMEMLPR